MLVILSLFLGSVTMLSINGFFGSISVENYGARYVPHDFSLLNEIPFEDGFSDEMVQSLQSLDCIKDFTLSKTAFIPIDFDANTLEPILKDGFVAGGGSDPAYYQNFVETMQDMANKGSYGTWVQTIDSKYIETYNKTHEDQIDIEAFEN